MDFIKNILDIPKDSVDHIQLKDKFFFQLNQLFKNSSGNDIKSHFPLKFLSALRLVKSQENFLVEKLPIPLDSFFLGWKDLKELQELVSEIELTIDDIFVYMEFSFGLDLLFQHPFLLEMTSEEMKFVFESPNRDMITPLHQAIVNDRKEAIKIMMKYHFSLGEKTMRKYIGFFTFCKNPEIVEILLQNGLKPLEREINFLHSIKDVKIAELVLRYLQLDVNQLDSQGYTPMDITHNEGDKELFKFWESRGGCFNYFKNDLTKDNNLGTKSMMNNILQQMGGGLFPKEAEDAERWAQSLIEIMMRIGDQNGRTQQNGENLIRLLSGQNQ